MKEIKPGSEVKLKPEVEERLISKGHDGSRISGLARGKTYRVSQTVESNKQGTGFGLEGVFIKVHGEKLRLILRRSDLLPVS